MLVATFLYKLHLLRNLEFLAGTVKIIMMKTRSKKLVLREQIPQMLFFQQLAFGGNSVLI